jgi:hypothetical protein
VNDIAYAVVRQRKQELMEFREKQQENGILKGRRSDIISLYLERHDEESKSNLSSKLTSSFKPFPPSPPSAEDGELSDDVLRDVVTNFMIAGRDTTANVTLPSLRLQLMQSDFNDEKALSWSLYRLCLHPELQERATKEVLEVFEKFCLQVPITKDHSRFRISYECLQEMKYLEAFAMEVLVLILPGMMCSVGVEIASFPST